MAAAIAEMSAARVQAPSPPTRDAELRQRATRVVPGGMWGHMNAARMPGGFPQYFRSAGGCRLIDVDGREYVDDVDASPSAVDRYSPGFVRVAARSLRATEDPK